MHSNTTALIGAWTMDGAHDDLGGRFHSAVDIHAAVSELRAKPKVERTALEAAPLLVKSAGDEDWALLPA